MNGSRLHARAGRRLRDGLHPIPVQGVTAIRRKSVGVCGWDLQ
jgi:hypothetical protein